MRKRESRIKTPLLPPPPPGIPHVDKIMVAYAQYVAGLVPISTLMNAYEKTLKSGKERSKW